MSSINFPPVQGPKPTDELQLVQMGPSLMNLIDAAKAASSAGELDKDAKKSIESRAQVLANYSKALVAETANPVGRARVIHAELAGTAWELQRIGDGKSPELKAADILLKAASEMTEKHLVPTDPTFKGELAFFKFYDKLNTAGRDAKFESSELKGIARSAQRMIDTVRDYAKKDPATANRGVGDMAALTAFLQSDDALLADEGVRKVAGEAEKLLKELGSGNWGARAKSGGGWR